MESTETDIWTNVKMMMKSENTKISDIVEALTYITDTEMTRRMKLEDPQDYYLWDLLHIAMHMNSYLLLLSLIDL